MSDTKNYPPTLDCTAKLFRRKRNKRVEVKFHPKPPNKDHIAWYRDETRCNTPCAYYWFPTPEGSTIGYWKRVMPRKSKHTQPCHHDRAFTKHSPADVDHGKPLPTTEIDDGGLHTHFPPPK